MFKPRNTGQKFALGAVLAGVTGFVVGILAAPKSGKETREDLKSSTKIAIRQAEKDLKSAHTELQSLISSGNQKLRTGSKVAKREFSKAVKRAKNAQKGVKEVLSVIHEGTADSPELVKALKEANAAKAHLKKYLSGVVSKVK